MLTYSAANKPGAAEDMAVAGPAQEVGTVAGNLAGWRSEVGSPAAAAAAVAGNPVADFFLPSSSCLFRTTESRLNVLCRI